MSSSQNRVIERMVALAKEFSPITKIILYGSRAKDNSTSVSDYDIAVFWDSKATEGWGAFTEKLREENPTLNQMDIVRWDRIGQTLKKRILDEGKVVYDKTKTKL